MPSGGKREFEKNIYAETISGVLGEFSGDLVLEAAIPLKPGVAMSTPHAESLGRHVKLYLSHNPEEARLFISALNGENARDALSFEMMLERDQHLRLIILRSILYIMQKGNWQFGQTIDIVRLERLVTSMEKNPSAYRLESELNSTLRQGVIPIFIDPE